MHLKPLQRQAHAGRGDDVWVTDDCLLIGCVIFAGHIGVFEVRTVIDERA